MPQKLAHKTFYKLLPPSQLLLNQPANSKDHCADASVAKFEAEVAIFQADDQAVHHLEKADGLNDFGDEPEGAIHA